MLTDTLRMCSGLRRHCLPVWQPLIRPFRLHTFAAWALSFAGRCLVFLIDLLYGKAVRALIPTAMIMLLMVYGAGSSSSILNGLSVAFVLHLDNHIPSTLLSGNDAVNIRATLNVHLADMKRVHLEGAAGDASVTGASRTGLYAPPAPGAVRPCSHPQPACVRRASPVVSSHRVELAPPGLGRAECTPTTVPP